MKRDSTHKKRNVILAAVILAVVFCVTSIAIILQKMQTFGIFAPILFVLLQVAQVVIAVIPGGPVPIIGGLLFGEGIGLLLSMVGFFFGTVIVYYLVQKFGRPIVSLFVSEDKMQKYAYLATEKKLEVLVFALFLLPGLPKDALTYIVSFNTKIKPMRLFVLTTLARLPSAALSVFLGGSIWKGRYWLAVCFLFAMLLLGICGYFIKKKCEKQVISRTKNQFIFLYFTFYSYSNLDNNEKI